MDIVGRRSVKMCGVPQCNSQRQFGITLHKIPKEVLKSKKLTKKWMHSLRMGKKFPIWFQICSLHFEKEDFLIPLKRAGVKQKTILKKQAFPTKNLPQSSIKTKPKTNDRENRLRARKEKLEAAVAVAENIESEREFENTSTEYLTLTETVSTQTMSMEFRSIKTQTYSKSIVLITSMWDDDSKLYEKTGISSLKILDTIVRVYQMCCNKENSLMSIRDKILLTFHRLKCNPSFTEIGIDFMISRQSAKRYFAETIQILADVMRDLIYWQSREQNKRNLPTCFQNFSNVMTVLDCTEIRTIKFGCLSCRTPPYSFYKGMHTGKILIGVAPSGLINYISPMVCGKSSDKAIFNLTDLIKKLKLGDAVMVDKEFMIGNELAEAGIEMVRPSFHFESFSKSDVQRNTNIASARVHVERRISRIKNFKVLSEKIGLSLLPYIDEILIVICGLSNLSSPIQNNEKFK